MSIPAMRVTLSDQGEGWFTGYADVSGSVESIIQDDTPYYLVRLGAPLELQEAGAATPSEFILRHCSHCVVHCRWQGTDINVDAPVSVHVRLVPVGTETPKTKTDIAGMAIRAWAACVVRLFGGPTYFQGRAAMVTSSLLTDQQRRPSSGLPTLYGLLDNL
jgi:hypothetical protein